MKRKLLSILLLLVSLAACRATNGDTPTPTVIPPTATNEIAVTEVTEIEDKEEATAVVPTLTPESQPTTPTNLPAPTLFTATTWENRDLYRAGLRPDHQGILDQLLDAPIYHMDITVEENDGALNRIIGIQELLYTNQEQVEIDTLYFHLFPNLLGRAINISNVTVNGQPATHQPQEQDNSILQVPLTEPLAPNEQAIIKLDFTTIVPEELERNYGVFAYNDNVLAMAHFFPMLSVYDDTGWNTAPAPEAGDVVYADTSFYLVRLTAPDDQVIATSGSEIERVSDGNQQTITYAAGPVRDFYVAMSNEYVPISQQVGDITLNSYARAQYTESAQQALAYATAAIQIFSDSFTPYPYTELDIVTTPTLALGVEYPGLFVNTERIYGDDERYASYLEGTTVHEMAHQWFYNIIGNDQLDEPWLDESLAQYATWLYFREQYGEQGANGFYDSLDYRWSTLGYDEMPIGLPVSAYEGIAYSAIIYGRGPIFVLNLKEEMGEDNFDAFLQDYFTTYLWQNSDTETFKTLAEHHCDCDLTPIFTDWIYQK